MLEELAKDDPDVTRIRRELAIDAKAKLDSLAETMDSTLKTAAKEVLHQLLELQLTDRSQHMLDRLAHIKSQDGDLGRAVDALKSDPALYAAAIEEVRSIENFERAFVFVYLSKYFNCGLFGGVDYSVLGCQIKSAGFIPYEQQASFYSRGQIGLSVMRWQDEEGLHIKPYEITAAASLACVSIGQASRNIRSRP